MDTWKILKERARDARSRVGGILGVVIATVVDIIGWQQVPDEVSLGVMLPVGLALAIGGYLLGGIVEDWWRYQFVVKDQYIDELRADLTEAHAPSRWKIHHNRSCAALALDGRGFLVVWATVTCLGKPGYFKEWTVGFNGRLLRPYRLPITGETLKLPRLGSLSITQDELLHERSAALFATNEPRHGVLISELTREEFDRFGPGSAIIIIAVDNSLHATQARYDVKMLDHEWRTDIPKSPRVVPFSDDNPEPPEFSKPPAPDTSEDESPPTA